MKKVLATALCFALVFCFASCGKPSATEEPVNVNLKILKEQDDNMINTYSLLAVNPDAPWTDADGNAVDGVEPLNTAGAEAFINWMLSEGAELAAEYGVADYGENLFYLLDDRPQSNATIPKATEDTKTVRISTTTSVNDSGLLSYVLPFFEDEYGYKVEVFSAGTGKAIANAKCGNADAILVHAKKQEEEFVADGYAKVIDGQTAERLPFMYNFFVLVGPEDDPAGVADASDVLEAFATIAEGKHKFVSRGDGSGTHTKELSLWPPELGITEDPETFAPYKDWYISSNAGMGECLLQASEKGAYILSDKATFLTFVSGKEG